MTIESKDRKGSCQIRMIEAQDTIDLRHRILRPHQSREDCIYSQDRVDGSFHLGAYEGDRLLGIGSFHVEAFPDLGAKHPYRLRGMAIETSCQGRGIGRDLLERAFEELSLRGSDLLWCNARKVAFSFYEKLGLSYHGDLFEIAGIGPHRVMFRYLKSGQDLDTLANSPNLISLLLKKAD